MPCYFCVAVFMTIAGVVTTAVLDLMEHRLNERASEPVRRVADTDSVRKIEATVKIDRQEVPVAVTIYKDHSRVRIQVLTHDLSRPQVERVEDELAEVLELRIVDRSRPEIEAGEVAGDMTGEGERARSSEVAPHRQDPLSR